MSNWIPALPVGVLAAALAGLGAHQARAAQPAYQKGLHVIPFPRTPDASPHSNIIFSSLTPTQIISITVTGSKSGVHTGQTTALPDHAGTAFIPTSPFTSSEQITVTATLNSPAAGTASGAPNSTTLHYTFTTATPLFGSSGSSGSAALAAAVAAKPSGSCPVCQRYRSDADLHPPIVKVTSDPDQRSGDIFLTPRVRRDDGFPVQQGPMILDARGRLVWFDPLAGAGAFTLHALNLQVQHYQGRPVLTWWQGLGIGPGGEGRDVVMNAQYRSVAVVRAGEGYYAGVHDFQITSRGTAFLECAIPVRANLTGIGGPSDGFVWDSVVQEVDIRTGQVLWEWHALGHVPLRASGLRFTSGRFDYFHLNSIQQLPGGNLLISARNTSAIYDIDEHTGRLVWTLGGKDSGFRIGPGANFSWQHDARLYPRGTLTLFDDSSSGAAAKESQSSAKVLRLNFKTMTATLARQYTHRPPLSASSQGSAQLLNGGNMFVGWGNQPEFSEYEPHGKQIFNGVFPFLGTLSYRAFRFRWGGMPVTSPSLALVAGGSGDLRVYASWNGATQVASWRVLGGLSSSSLGVFGSAGWGGFETEATLHSNPGVVEVQAIGSGGKVLGTSAVDPDPAHVDVFSPEVFARASSGTGEVPVGCYTGQSCQLTVRVLSGSSVLAQSSAQNVAAGAGALVGFKLSSAGRADLARASNHRLPVQIKVSDSSSGRSAMVSVNLVPYSIAGSGPTQSASQSSTIQLARTTGFVSSVSGIGQILAGCDATTQACQPKVKITAGGKVIATNTDEHLGAQELGDVYFTLTKTGQTMLSHAHGNQLAAQITLTDSNNTATGHIALVHYR